MLDGVLQLPDTEAVRFEGVTLTYQALARRTNQTALALRGLGVARGDRVGIYVSKGLDAVVAMYGVLKAGAAYVPLDPWLPAERLGGVLADCGIRVVFAEPARRRILRTAQTHGGEIDWVVGPGAEPDDTWRSLGWRQVEELPETAPDTTGLDQDLAYIFYTSGSTGEPKGMVHTHRSGLSFVEWASGMFALRPDDRIGNHAPLHFDLSLFDYLSAAAARATTVIVSEERQKIPASMSQLIQDERLTVWYSVPVAWTHMVLRGSLDRRDLGALRLVLFGGERFPTAFLRAAMEHAPRAEFWHLYGVTESNVCTFYHVPRPLPDDHAPLPIGRLCPNMEAVELDGDRPVACGEVGELAVRGAAVMEGYWNRPDANDHAFWRRPGAGTWTQRFYRTGDRVRLDANGHYHLLGRVDRQIKSRGHRIELDEVEAALNALPAVEEAVVFATADGEGSQRLEVAVAVRDGYRWNEAEVRRALADRTAAYAVPPTFQVLTALPRTSAGKVDFMALRQRATSDRRAAG